MAPASRWTTTVAQRRDGVHRAWSLKHGQRLGRLQIAPGWSMALARRALVVENSDAIASGV
jgi:hypothetical protein